MGPRDSCPPHTCTICPIAYCQKNIYQNQFSLCYFTLNLPLKENEYRMYANSLHISVDLPILINACDCSRRYIMHWRTGTYCHKPMFRYPFSSLRIQCPGAFVWMSSYMREHRQFNNPNHFIVTVWVLFLDSFLYILVSVDLKLLHQF